jgi:CheY-like chemotaxis protein
MKYAVLIDDDAVTNFINTRILLKSQLVDRVHSIESTEEALRYFEAISVGKEPIPFLVLVDIRMPVMDGFMLTDEIFARHPSLIGESFFFFLSSSLNPKDEERAKANAFCNGFLRKPLSMACLEDIMR